MNNWIKFEDELPKNGEKVEARGNPTICCEEDMGEEGIFKCVFDNRPLSWRIAPNGEKIILKMSECFRVQESDENEVLINIVEWRRTEETMPTS